MDNAPAVESWLGPSLFFSALVDAGNYFFFQTPLHCRPEAYQPEAFRTRVLPLLRRRLRLRPRPVHPSEAALRLPRPLTRIANPIVRLKKLRLIETLDSRCNSYNYNVPKYFNSGFPP